MRSKYLAPPTADESARVELAKTYGCIACLMDGRPRSEHCGVLENHHLVSGVRHGHIITVILGAWHHRGIVLKALLSVIGAHLNMRHSFGPSLAEGSKPFHARYGSDQDLLDYQNKLIGYPLVRIPTKRRRQGSTLTPGKMLPNRY